MKNVLSKTKRVVNLVLSDIWNIKWAFICICLWIEFMKFIFGAMCPLVIITGLPCPGCGMTRAMFSVFKFDFEAASSYNLCIFLWIGLALWWAFFRYIKEKTAPGIKLILGVVIFITIIYYIIRMKNSFPGVSPMTYKYSNVLSNHLPFYNKLIRKIFGF